jgi:dolichol-phosphate hexosyltransferase
MAEEAPGSPPVVGVAVPNGTPWTMLLVAALLGALTALWSARAFPPSGDDEITYDLLARNISAGHGLSVSTSPPFEPSALRAPVYPLFLAFVYSTIGEDDRSVLLAQTLVLASGWAMLTALAAVLFGHRVALLTCLLSALNPYLGRWAAPRLTEAVYMALMIGCVLAFVRGLTYSRVLPFVAAGILWGAAVLCRPASVVLLPLMLAVIYLFSPRVQKRHDASALLLLAGLAALTPWVVRNWIAFQAYIPLQVHAVGANFWLTTLDPEDQPVVTFNGMIERWRVKYPEVQQYTDAGANTLRRREAERRLTSEAIRRIKDHPGAYLSARMMAYPRLWLHSGRLWYGSISFSTALAAGRYDIVCVKVLLFLLLSLVPLALTALGAFRYRRSWRRLLPLFIVPIALTVVHIPMWIEDRYGMPAVPFFLVLVALSLSDPAVRPALRGNEATPLDTVSVIIPMKNEGTVGLEMARSVRSHVGSFVNEIIVVDGHSSDGGPAALRDEGFRVLEDRGRGKGDGLRAGIGIATGKILVFMDADGSHDPADIPALLAPIRDGHADMVIGCRMRGGSDEFAGSWALFVRLWGNNVLTLLLNSRYGVRLTDSQNGFRAARADMLRALDLRENRHTIELEMIMKSLRHRHRVIQIPSHEYSRRAGHSSLSVIGQAPHFLWCSLRNMW